MYSRTINLLTLSSWIMVIFIEDVSCECTEVATKPGCADGWSEMHSPSVCIKLFQDTPMTWEESEDYCNKIDPLHSTLWFPVNPNQQGLLEQYLQTEHNGSVRTFWVGLKYGLKGLKGLRKSNGMKGSLQTSFWRPQYPRDTQTNRCLLFQNGQYANQDCKQKHNFLCIREHQIYYREMELSIKYHDIERSPHILYIGRDVEFTCSVFLPSIRPHDVHIYYDKTTKIGRSKEEWELQQTEYGLCSNQSFTTSKLQNYDGSTHKTDFLTISCGYSTPSSTCGVFPMDFCLESSFPVVFLDPPVNKVNLSVERVAPTTVILTCTVNTFRTGVLTWIQWVGSEASMVDLRIHMQNFSSITLENNRTLTTSTIMMNFTEEQGIDVICFDHQVWLFDLNMKCTDTDAAQMYCQRFFVEPSEPPTPEAEPTNWLLPILGLIALLVVIFLGWAISRNPKDGHHGGVGEMDKAGDSHAVTETVTETVTVTETETSQGTSLRQSGTSTDIDIVTPLKIPDKKQSDQRLKRSKKRQSKTDNRKSYGYTHQYNSY